MLLKSVKTGLFLAIGGCILSPLGFNSQALGSSGPSEISVQVEALTQLADEYAATGKAKELKKAISTLSLLREEWEATEKTNPHPDDVEATKSIQRAEIENTFSGLDEMDGVPVKSKKGYLNEFNGSSLKPKEIVITFDDGPHPTLTPQVHAIIKGLKIPAAFFEIGINVKAYPDQTRSLAADGYVIGDHSWDHPQLTSLSDAAVAKEINDTQNIIQSTLGGANGFNLYFQNFFEKFFAQQNTIYAPEFFRSPYGARSSRTMKIISNTAVGGENELVLNKPEMKVDDLYHIMWNVDSLDWQDHNPATIETRVMNQIATYGHHGIILFHDIHPQTIIAIQSILPRLLREGYKLISLYDMVEESLPAEDRPAKVN
jgi:peptidoglycan/xylan/chitin deacetylase (PgdA/CDA1 family)